MKKILILIAFKDYQDYEYGAPKEIFEAAGFEVATASWAEGEAQGTFGGFAKIDISASEADVNDYDAVVFVGGSGAYDYFENEDYKKLAWDAVQTGKLLGAICIAPLFLAKIGILKDKNATVWNNKTARPLPKTPAELLADNGATYLDQKVVIDGKIITGNGPGAAEEFGNKIVEILTDIVR